MIDVANEQLLTIRQAAEHCSVKPLTIRTWITKGVKGKVLESCKLGGGVRTSKEAIARFSDQGFVAPITNKERVRNQLAALGIQVS